MELKVANFTHWTRAVASHMLMLQRSVQRSILGRAQSEIADAKGEHSAVRKKLLLGEGGGGGLNQGCSLMAWSPEKPCVFEASEERFPCFQRGILIKVVGFCICS